MRISVGMLGGRMYYGVPSILEKNNMLATYFTDFVTNKMPFSLFKSLPGLKKKINTRNCPIKPKYIQQLPISNLFSIFNQRNKKGIEIQKQYLRTGLQLEKFIIGNNFGGANALFMIGSSSGMAFKKAHEGGIYTIKEQSGAPAAFVKEILKSEWENFSDWENCILEKEIFNFWVENTVNEYSHCNLLVCPSKYVEGAVKALHPEINTVLVPFGIPAINSAPSSKTFPVNRKLKILSVGRVSLSKGSHYILQAAKELSGQCEFYLAGNVHFNNAIIKEYSPYVTFLGHLPRTELMSFFKNADVFLLPSLSEGSATVCYEALMHGLPLIVTYNAGQFIEHGREGFIIETKSAAAIVSAIQEFLNKPLLVEEMSSNALNLSKYGSFEAYEKRILNILKSLG